MELEPQLKVEGAGGSGRRFAFLIGGATFLGLIVLGAILFFGHGKSQQGAAAIPSLPFGPAEQAYAQRIQFTDIQMSRATNFLNQEITYISGTVVNNGPQKIRAIDVVCDFHDFSGKVIIHDARGIAGNGATPIAPGARQNFQLSFESVPDSWNQYYPDIKITGLALE